jgi:hypothetical protein
MIVPIPPFAGLLFLLTTNLPLLHCIPACALLRCGFQQDCLPVCW